MRKQEFLAQLHKGLSGLPQSDIEERLAFYNEMIEDHIEEGLSEEEAVSAVGSVDEIVTQITADIPLTKTTKEKIKSNKPNRRLTAGEIILLVLGSPLWLSLGIAAIAVTLSLYISLWAVIVSLWAVFASVAACSIGGVLTCIFFSKTLKINTQQPTPIPIAGYSVRRCLLILSSKFTRFILRE